MKVDFLQKFQNFAKKLHIKFGRYANLEEDPNKRDINKRVKSI